MCYHALREQRVKRLNRFFRQVAGNLHRAGEEARIQQVQNRVFDATDILVHIHPVFRIRHIGRRVSVWRGKASEIPRGIDECVHRIGFAFRGRTARRAGAVAPCGVSVQRVAGRVKADVIGQLDRQVLFLFGHHAAGVAMHDRDRAAPVALPGQAPIAQAVFGHALAHALRFAGVDGRNDRLFAGLPFLAGKAAVVIHFFGFRRHEGRGELWVRVLGRQEGRRDRQPVFGGEFKVPCVMGGAAKDRPCAVVHQDEVRDIDGQFPRGIEGVAHTQAGIHPQLFGSLDRFFGCAALATFGTEGRNLGAVFLEQFGQRVIG